MPVNAVIIVGGPSTVTDFRPLSLYQPKPLFPIAGRPLIYHHLKALAALPDLQEVFLVGYYEASHYVEKPETNVSDLISCGIYVFSNLIFDEVRRVVLESELK